jgi:hypothetical protein
MAVFERIRTRNMPDKVGNDFYRLCGIGDAVFGRVTQALTFLGLTSADGTPSDTLIAMGRAPEPEFKELLASAVREAYADDFKNTSPEHDGQGTIIDHFRRYHPRSQVARMVALWLGLCREAGIPVKDVPRDRKMVTSTPKKKATSTPPKTETRPPKQAKGDEASQSGAQTTAGLLFGFTEADVAVLDDGEFQEVWTALGKVARARAQAKQVPTDETPASPNQADEEDEQ